MRIADRLGRDNLTREVLEFAQWAFSKDGLPDLEILAWGDLSDESRWDKHSMLLCRDLSLLKHRGANFRTLAHSDTYYWSLIHGNMDMLAV